MGCTQPTSTIAPINQIPIERLFVTQNATEVKPPPVVMITAEPTPPYIKGVLKKGIPGVKNPTNIIAMINSKPPPLDKVVSFDGQVLVRDRTPTPKKAWYEKASRTMPMRKRPRNDNDDYDYDDEEEIPSASSDEDDGNDINQPLIAPLQQLTLPPQWNRPDTYWPYRRTSQGFAPVMNNLPETNPYSTMIPETNPYPPMIPETNPYRTMFPETDPYPTMFPQPAYDLDQNQTDYSPIPKANNIKVRRRLADYGPPQIAPLQTGIGSPNQPLLHSPYSPITQPSNLQTTMSPILNTKYGYNRLPIENVT